MKRKQCELVLLKVEFDILLLSFWPEGRHKTAAHHEADSKGRRRRSAEQRGERIGGS